MTRIKELFGSTSDLTKSESGGSLNKDKEAAAGKEPAAQAVTDSKGFLAVPGSTATLGASAGPAPDSPGGKKHCRNVTLATSREL